MGKFNLKNEKFKEYYQLACEDLWSAKALLKKSKKAKSVEKKQGYKRKAVQSILESMEHSLKAYLYALNEEPSKIHDIENLQKELNKNDCNLLTKKDIKSFHEKFEMGNEKKLYNAVRYIPQDFSDDFIDEAIKIAEKVLKGAFPKYLIKKRKLI